MEDAGKTEVQEIAVPANALTTCPIRRYGQVSIKGCCVACPHFRGLFDVMAQDAPFAEKYRVQCGVPQARDILMFEEGTP